MEQYLFSWKVWERSGCPWRAEQECSLEFILITFWHELVSHAFEGFHTSHWDYCTIMKWISLENFALDVLKWFVLFQYFLPIPLNFLRTVSPFPECACWRKVFTVWGVRRGPFCHPKEMGWLAGTTSLLEIVSCLMRLSAFFSLFI